jgi:hypothetical protein
MARLHHTIHALTACIARERCGLSDPVLLERVVAFVRGQFLRSPGYLRPPIRVLTLMFDAGAILRFGKPFHSLPHVQRWNRLQGWRSSRFGFRRDYVRFFESLIIVALFEYRDGIQP